MPVGSAAVSHQTREIHLPQIRQPHRYPFAARHLAAIAQDAAVGTRCQRIAALQYRRGIEAVQQRCSLAQPGASLSQRLEAPVVLTLPPTLFDMIRREAGKLGLGRAARVGEVSATLSGQGYEITPNGPQTARLKSGEAASFQWQVKPGAGDLGPLRAQIDVALRGQRTPVAFPLGTITKAAPELAPARADLRRLDLGEVDVPGIGRMRGDRKSVV